MNINQEEDSIDSLQEKEKHYNIRSIRDPYLKSQIPTVDPNLNNAFALQEIENLYNEITKLEEAIKIGDQKIISNFFKKFIDNFEKVILNEEDILDYIEFIFPYILQLIQIDTPEKTLLQVLLSLYRIISRSHYYSLEFFNSSAYKKLLLIIQTNIIDYITGISIHIIISLSHYDELQDIIFSIFPLQSIVDCFLSNEYQTYSKESFLLLFEEYLLRTTDNDELCEIFSCISKCLMKLDLEINYIHEFLYIIGNFYIKNTTKSIEFVPEEMIEFISEKIFEIVKFTQPTNSYQIFYFIYILTANGIIFYYPVEEFYQIVLDTNTKKNLKEYIISMMTNSIKISDDIEYSKLFITESLKDVIEYCFDDGSKKSRSNSLIFIELILATDNLELFISILKSPTFINFLEFAENVDDLSAISKSVTVLGNALHLLLTIIPNSEEVQYFLSTILSSELIERLNLLSEQSDRYREYFMHFCSLIELESVRISEES